MRPEPSIRSLGTNLPAPGQSCQMLVASTFRIYDYMWQHSLVCLLPNELSHLAGERVVRAVLNSIGLQVPRLAGSSARYNTLPSIVASKFAHFFQGGPSKVWPWECHILQRSCAKILGNSVFAGWHSSAIVSSWRWRPACQGPPGHPTRHDSHPPPTAPPPTPSAGGRT
jgi:hypothetical protein